MFAFAVAVFFALAALVSLAVIVHAMRGYGAHLNGLMVQRAAMDEREQGSTIKVAAPLIAMPIVYYAPRWREAIARSTGRSVNIRPLAA